MKSMNWLAIVLSLVSGALCAAVIASVIRVLWGMRLNLILINHDSAIRDQSFIPVSTENKKNHLWRTLLNGNWKEDVEVTVADDHGHFFTFRVGFHWWNRFFFRLVKLPEQSVNDLEIPVAKHNLRTILLGETFWARTGDRLDVGDRRFYLMVTPEPIRPDRHEDLYEKI